jgi:two-component sensor histidine kinase
MMLLQQTELHLTELNHRVRNEYARVIALACHLSASSASMETKTTLDRVVDHLMSAAQTHVILQPPRLRDVLEDLTDRINRLCRAVSASSELKMSGVRISVDECDVIYLESVRGWWVGLIIAELIENARRHAFGRRAGEIRIALRQAGQSIVCQVADSGRPSSDAQPGLGTSLIDELAEKLGGYIQRRFDTTGSTITLSFPLNAPA